jgi:hypothetical protein
MGAVFFFNQLLVHDRLIERNDDLKDVNEVLTQNASKFIFQLLKINKIN